MAYSVNKWTMKNLLLSIKNGDKLSALLHANPKVLQQIPLDASGEMD